MVMKPSSSSRATSPVTYQPSVAQARRGALRVAEIAQHAAGSLEQQQSLLALRQGGAAVEVDDAGGDAG